MARRLADPAHVLSVDALIQPHVLRPNGLPFMVEAKSAADFDVSLKRRQEAKTVKQLQTTFASEVCYVVCFCGYFDSGYLGYEAADGIDWVWTHQMTDLDHFAL